MQNKKNNIIILAILIALFLFLLAACKEKQPANPSPAGPLPSEPEPGATEPTTQPAKPTPEEETMIGYFPLKVGNTWEYEGKGMEYAEYKQWVKYEKENKYQVMVDNGGTLIASVFTVGKDSIATTYKESEASDEKNVLDMKNNVDITVLKLPLKKGTSWVSEENSYSIVQTDAEITVPAGSFKDCVVVKAVFKDKATFMLFYYKKSIGLVQSEFHAENGEIITSKLKKYQLNE